MCGIVGVFKKGRTGVATQKIVEVMTDAIAHRGPDDSGCYVDDYIGLGHRRLAVIDLHSGHQPMIDHVNRKVLIFNGEIYNYETIRRQLSSKGESFETNSDTEVLLKLADPCSLMWINKLLGMFAFAVWNKNTKQLLLCRDRLGVKPLYYIDLPDVFIFSSEIKAILRYPGVNPRLNSDKVAEFVAFRNISGKSTLFQDIFELPPGHILKISVTNNRPHIEKYWPFSRSNDVASTGETAVEEFETYFEQAVKPRLIGDVPLGTFNSGGVDSSLVSMFVSRNKSDALHTFSVGFAESDYDESAYAEFVARKFGTNHHKLMMNQREYLDAFDKTMVALEEPLNHPHTVPLYLLCKEAKRFVTVVLTGEGADEMFGGYPRYQIAQFANAIRWVPRAVRTAGQWLAYCSGSRRLTKLLEISGDSTRASIENSRFVPLHDLGLVFENGVDWLGERQQIFAGYSDEKNFLERLLAYERDTYLQSLLVRLDKVSMAHGLEARVPFLDHRLVCWSRQLPSRYKILLLRDSKVIVKKCARRYFPKNFVYRKKMGFGVPISEWMRDNKGLGAMLDLLLDQSFRRRYPFSFSNLEKMIAEHRNGTANHVEALWGILSLELWCRHFIDGDPIKF